MDYPLQEYASFPNEAANHMVPDVCARRPDATVWRVMWRMLWRVAVLSHCTSHPYWAVRLA